MSQLPSQVFPQQIVVAPQHPGVIRSFLNGVGRMISSIIVTLVIFAGIIAVLMMFLGRETGLMPTVYRDGSGTSMVTVLDLEQDIAPDAAVFMEEAVNLILDRPRIRGVVFRVDSPGGDVTSADQIWYHMERLKKRGIKVVASYGSVAASGGYYVSCGSDAIFAEPTTVTGSIGVIMQALTFEEILKKVGIAPVTLVAEGSPSKDLANNMYRTWGEADLNELRPMIDSAYELFLARVTAGRAQAQPDAAALKAVCDGRIYTANQAVANKLVDQIGYLDDAVDHCIQLCALPADTRVLWIEPMGSPLGDLPLGLTWNGGGAGVTGGGHVTVGVDAEAIRSAVNELARPKLMYMWP